LVGTNNPSPKEKALLRKLAEDFGGRSTATNAEGIERTGGEQDQD
jgi:hypothetical protein